MSAEKQKDSQEQKDTEQPKFEDPVAKAKRKKALFIAQMLWPPVMLVILGILSLFVNVFGSVSTAAPQTLSPNPSTADELAAAATPTWIESVNTLIFICVIVALVFVALNFAIGMFIVMKNHVSRFEKYME